MARSTDLLRPVSGLERAWLVAGRLLPPFAIHLVVEAPGPLDAMRWIPAITRAADVWPGLRARLAGTLRSTRWIAEDRPLSVAIAEAPWDGAGPHAALDTPLLPGPGARVMLWPAAGRAVFSAHHAITDGRGLLGFVADVTRALAGDAPRGAAGGPLTDADLARRVWQGALPPDARPTANTPFRNTPADLPGTVWRRRRLPLRRAVVARAARSTVLAAGHALRLGIPVDLRRLEPALASSANLTGVAHIEADVGDGIPSIAAALRAAIEGRSAEANALQAHGLRGLPLWLMTAVARRSTRRTAGSVTTSAVISSLGRHDLMLDGRPLRVLFVPPGSEGLPLFMGLSGDAEGIELAAVCPRAWAGARGEHLDGWLDRFEAAFTADDNPS